MTKQYSGGKLQPRVYFAFVCMQRWQLCYQRLFRRVFLWILVVQFMFTDRICVVTPSYGGEGWDGVMLVQYCIRPEVEIILFAIIAVKHLISHRTLSHTNIPALGFERRGKTSKNNSGVAVCMLIFLFKIWLWLFGLIMSYWCSHNGPKEPMNIINKRQHCAFYRKKNLRNSYSSHSLRGCLVSSLPAIMQTLESFHVGIRVHVSS